MKSISIIGGNCEVSNDSLLLIMEKCLEDNINIQNYDKKDDVFELIMEDNVVKKSITASLLDYHS